MRTTTTIPTTLKVLMNHIYELHRIMGSVLVIILSTSELLQMKRQLVLTVVGLQPQRREHI